MDRSPDPETAVSANSSGADGPVAARFGYPVVLDLRGVAVLVVGAGAVGARKVAGLAAAGAAVHVVATRFSAALDPDMLAKRIEREFRDADLDGMHLVITATGDADLDAAVASAARRRGIWVNAADQATDCDFVLPAIARAGRVTVAVSTDGASPALAQRIRDRVAAEVLDDRVAAAAEALAAERAELHAAGRSTESIDWRRRLDELLGD